jgi:hypothetical protein
MYYGWRFQHGLCECIVLCRGWLWKLNELDIGIYIIAEISPLTKPTVTFSTLIMLGLIELVGRMHACYNVYRNRNAQQQRRLDNIAFEVSCQVILTCQSAAAAPCLSTYYAPGPLMELAFGPSLPANLSACKRIIVLVLGHELVRYVSS